MVMRLPAAVGLLVIVGAAAGCGDDHSDVVHCTAVGCAPGGRFNANVLVDASVKVTVEACINSTCGAVDMMPAADSGVRIDNVVALVWIEPHASDWDLSIEYSPQQPVGDGDTYRAKVTEFETGTTLLDVEDQVTYGEPHYPNGEKCGGVCRAVTSGPFSGS